MIAPKTATPTAAQETTAYELATLRDRNTCTRCGLSGVIQRDHRKNRSQRGLTVVENLQCLCWSCHLWKTEHPRDAIAEGFMVPSWADPAEWPARRCVKGRLVWVAYVPIEEYATTPDGFRTLTESDARARMRELL